MGNISSINKINFEFVQNSINSKEIIIINTLNDNNQNCLIKNTLSINQEVSIITNNMKSNKNIKIIIYGENSCDNSIIIKYNQLYKLGFKNIYVYVGGLFEWLLLQDIYGEDEFPTTDKIIDILKYKGCNNML
tara:strand:- start:42 stop:440 length:399 start_codon:yes stop_codon:yes gene_type:complete